MNLVSILSFAAFAWSSKMDIRLMVISSISKSTSLFAIASSRLASMSIHVNGRRYVVSRIKSPAFLTVLSLYFLLKKKMASSVLSLLVATLYKVYPIAFIIPATIYLVRRSNRVDLIRYITVLLVPILAYLIVGGIQVVNSFSRFILLFFSTRTSG